MIKSSKIEKVGGTRHGFFTRRGGLSRGIYNSLNCGYGSNDNKNLICANRARAMVEIGLQKDSLVTANQIHSSSVKVVKKPWQPKSAPSVDGMVSCKSGVTLGVLTADCAPILFADPISGVIGAAHAGWRGDKRVFIEATVEAMISLGSQADQITVAIGPCIQKESYEVSDSFYKLFLDCDHNNKEFFSTSSSRAGHYHFDLPAYIVSILEKCSLNKIDVIKSDTYKDERNFYSYRRSTHFKDSNYGRLLSAIALVS